MEQEYKPFGELSREEQLELLNAWLDGKEIEFHTGNGSWISTKPSWIKDWFYRVKPVALTKPSIDWGAVYPGYKWLAVDANGEGYLYAEEPFLSGHNKTQWVAQGGHKSASIFTSYKRGTCNWKDSLVQRPEGA